MAKEEHGAIGILGDGAVDHDVGVVQDLIPAGVVRALALALTVAAVVEAVRADAGLVQLLGHVVITALVLAQAVHYDARGFVVRGDLWVIEEPRAVERGDELILCHGWPPCGRVRGLRAKASCAPGVGGTHGDAARETVARLIVGGRWAVFFTLGEAVETRRRAVGKGRFDGRYLT